MTAVLGRGVMVRTTNFGVEVQQLGRYNVAL